MRALLLENVHRDAVAVLVLEHQHALAAQLAEAAVADEMEGVDRPAGAQPRPQSLGGGVLQTFDLDQAALEERVQGRAEPPPLRVRLGELPVTSRGRDHRQNPQRRLDQQRLGLDPLLKRRSERDVGVVDVPLFRFDDFRLLAACQLPAVNRVSLLR